MSMQRIHNYGSSLQAYSLGRLIEEATPDARVSFVDYRPGPLLLGDREAPTSKLGRIVQKVREYNSVDAPLSDKLRFFEHKRAYGRRYFPELGIPANPNYDLPLECQVIGSDEVFNCVQSNTKVGYSSDLFGRGSRARRLISYAASFGNTTLEKIQVVGIESELQADLKKFHSISVRDKNSYNLVSRLTGREPELHVDPTLAYGLMGDSRIPTWRLHQDPYIIVYGYSGRLTSEENKSLSDYAGRIGARILTFGGLQACGDSFVECGPFELLAYFRDAIGVVTDTFHGTIFSIINHRPFATIIRSSAGIGYGNEEKLGYLLESFGLSSRRLAEPSGIDALLSTCIDKAAINFKIASERGRTMKYLSNNVPAATNR